MPGRRLINVSVVEEIICLISAVMTLPAAFIAPSQYSLSDAARPVTAAFITAVFMVP